MKFGKVDTIEGIDFSLPEIDQRSRTVLSSFPKTKQPEIRIGCSVWSNKDYVGSVYPLKTPQSKFLQAYTQQFNTVEVNATRYGMPKTSTLKGWKEKAPAGFKFSFKVPQPITNRKNLNDDEGIIRMDQFAAGMDLMGDKAGTSFIMLPQYFGLDRHEQLNTFLKNWPVELSASLELREPVMIHHERVRSLAETKRMSMCVTDTPGRRDVLHNYLTNEELYVRYAGTTDFDNSRARINDWVQRSAQLIELGVQRIYFMIHQPADERGSALEVARLFSKGILDHYPNANVTIPINHKQNTLF